MGQAFQRALRARGDAQALREGQRRWVAQRNSACARAAEVSYPCLLEMTQRRVAVLSEDSALTVGPAPSLGAAEPTETVTTTIVPTSATNPVANFAQVEKRAQPSSLVAQANKTSPSVGPEDNDGKSQTKNEGSAPVIVVLMVGLAVVIGLKIKNGIKRKRRREGLIARYGEVVAARIFAHEVWQGMTEDQVVESWGAPVDVDDEIRKSTRKQTWKYTQTGKNRFARKVFLENGVVIGWKV
jgi:hypothetical protein